MWKKASREKWKKWSCFVYFRFRRFVKETIPSLSFFFFFLFLFLFYLSLSLSLSFACPGQQGQEAQIVPSGLCGGAVVRAAHGRDRRRCTRHGGCGGSSSCSDWRVSAWIWMRKWGRIKASKILFLKQKGKNEKNEREEKYEGKGENKGRIRVKIKYISCP